METQPDATRKLSPESNKDPVSISSPVKIPPKSSSTPSAATSKVLIITPEQIAKLGLTQQISKAIQSQAKPKAPAGPLKPEVESPVPRRKNVRVSKITIINPKSSDDKNNSAKSEMLKNKQIDTWSTAAKNEASCSMKNEIADFVKGGEIKNSADDGQSNLKVSGEKRKQEDLELRLPKMRKKFEEGDDHDDVVLVNASVDQEIPDQHVSKPKSEDLPPMPSYSHQNVSVIVKNESKEQKFVSLNVFHSANNKQEENVDLPQIKTPTLIAETETNETTVCRPKMKTMPIILNTKRLIKSEQNPTVTPQENKIIIKEQMKEESPMINQNQPSQPRDDVKQKIHVLSNEQISLPRTYIAQLKSHMPDKSSVSSSAPLFIYKPSDIVDGNPIINLTGEKNDPEACNRDIKPEIHLIKEENKCDSTNSAAELKINPEKKRETSGTAEGNTSVKLEPYENENDTVSALKSQPSASENESKMNVENLNRCFVDKDMLVLINDKHLSKVLDNSEDEGVTKNSEKSLGVGSNSLGDAEKWKDTSKVKPNLAVIDLTKSVEDEELRNKTAMKQVSQDRVSSDQKSSPKKSVIIQGFAEKIRNKLEIADSIRKKTFSLQNPDKSSIFNNEKELKVNSNIRKTYSKKSKLLVSSVITECSKKDSEFSTTGKPEIHDEDLKTNSETNKTETSTVVSNNETDNFVTKLQDKVRNLIRQKTNEMAELDSKIAQSIKTKLPAKTETAAVAKSSETDNSITKHQEKSEKPVYQKIARIMKIETPTAADSSETHISITEHQEKDENSTHQQTNEDVKPTPKKRGRKKKSETETIKVEVRDNSPEPEIETSQRGRKRKVVNYFVLAEGEDLDEGDSTKSVKKPRHKTPPVSECPSTREGVSGGIVEIDTVISRNPGDNSINCTYSAQEVSAQPQETPKRKRGRPPRIRVVDISTISVVPEKTNNEKDIDSNNAEKTTEIIPLDAKRTSEIKQDDKNEVSLTDAEKANKKNSTEARPTTIEETNENLGENALSKARKTKDAKKTSEFGLADSEKTNELTPNVVHKTSDTNSTDAEKINKDTKRRKMRDAKKTSEISSVDVADTSASTTSATESSEKQGTQDADHSLAQELTPCTPANTSKKKRGRPWGNESSVARNLINSIFQQINTPSSVEAEKHAALNEMNIDNTETADDHPVTETVFIKTEVKTESDNKAAKKKRGRKGVESQSDSADESGSKDGQAVTCAVCNQEVMKASWSNHKLRHHNNLAWKVGEPPLDLNDQKFVMKVLTDIYKRRKPLYCEKCGESKKSVLGFLSHKSVCKKSVEEVSAVRVKCEFCDRSVLPVSMSAHLKFCKGTEAGNSSWEAESSQVKEEASPVLGKRNAAKKAHNLIKSLKEDGTIEPIDGKPTSPRMWFLNFDFRPTHFGKKRFRSEILRNGIAKCRFEGCEFETADLDEICSHLHGCDKKPLEGYTCKFCILTYKTENDILEHMREEHAPLLNSDEISADEEPGEEEDFDEEEDFFDEFEDDDKPTTNNKIKPTIYNKMNIMHGIKFLLKHRYCAPTASVLYPPALDWTLKFCKQNFSISNLFPNWRTTLVNWEKLHPRLIANYLPHLKYSACTAVLVNKKFMDPLQLDYEWRRYKLFEADLLENGTMMIFCGGPIFAMAWAPTLFDQTGRDQILAVSANCSIEKEYTLDKKYSESGLIQFWNCGPLSNDTPATDPPKLEFCIAHEFGPVWCLEWCPSGCYDVQPSDEHGFQRLGVLAVGCANSHIYLYSVCFPGQLSGKIFKPKPVLKLVLESVLEDTANNLEPQVTKISWSKASGHQYLVAGYANGMIAVYYLSTTSTLLQLGMDQNGIEMIMPYRVFNAHYHAVTALGLYHLNDGRRWIMTGSIDRSIKYWDLENPLVPITNITKFIVTDGVWLNHWLSTIQCFDDSCAGGLTYTAAHQLRNFESESSSIMHSNSRVTSITGSDWTNGFVQGNVVGEVKGFFPHQMFYSMDGDKSYRNKKVILGYARLVEKAVDIQERLEQEKQKLQKINTKVKQTSDGEQAMEVKFLPDTLKPEPTSYKEAVEKYGLVFCDMTLNSLKEFGANISSYFTSNKLDKLYVTRPNVYPLQSINKVALNPNQGSFLHLAAGYQAGFIRISRLSFLSNQSPY